MTLSACMRLFAYTCVLCVHMCLLHMCVCIWVCFHLHVLTHGCACMHTYMLCVFVGVHYACASRYLHVHINVCAFASMHTYVVDVLVWVCVCAHRDVCRYV